MDAAINQIFNHLVKLQTDLARQAAAREGTSDVQELRACLNVVSEHQAFWAEVRSYPAAARVQLSDAQQSALKSLSTDLSSEKGDAAAIIGLTQQAINASFSIIGALPGAPTIPIPRPKPNKR